MLRIKGEVISASWVFTFAVGIWTAMEGVGSSPGAEGCMAGGCIGLKAPCTQHKDKDSCYETQFWSLQQHNSVHTVIILFISEYNSFSTDKPFIWCRQSNLFPFFPNLNHFELLFSKFDECFYMWNGLTASVKPDCWLACSSCFWRGIPAPGMYPAGQTKTHTQLPVIGGV